MAKHARRGPKRVARRRARKGKKMLNTDVYRQTIKLTSVLTPKEGVLTKLSNFLGFFVSPVPGGGTGGVTMSLLGSPEYQLYCQMYDQMRVHSVTMKVIPRYNSTDSTLLVTAEQGLGGGAPATTAGKQVVYTVLDRDSVAPLNITTLKKYSSVKTHRMDRPFSRTYAVKYDGPNTWFNCQNQSDMGEIQKALGLFGGITCYGESFIERLNQAVNTPWADLEVTYQCSFRGKSLISVAFDQDTNSVTISQTPASISEDVLVFESNDNIPNYGSIDNSGNVIVS